MATNRPRITVTLTDRQYEVLKSISDSTGDSMSSFLSELVELSLPTFERMAVTFAKIKEAQLANRDRLVTAIDEAQRQIEPLALAVAGQFDLFLGEVERSAIGSDVHAKSVRAEASGEPLSPSTNRGVTPSKGKGLKAKPVAASKPISSRKVSAKTKA